MFDMERDRLDFAELLAPDPGFEVSRAVGTTYSLDMRALLGACLAMTGDDMWNGNTGAGKVNVFASVSRLRGRLAVFCEKGRITDEKATGRLSILLEDLVKQVVVRKPRNLGASSIASFHPKVWFVEYRREGKGEARYRMLVMSRNLTLDGSWDVSVRLDGEDTGSEVAESQSIVAFLDYLARNSGVERDRKTTQLLKGLSAALSRVRFSVDTGDFDGYEFMPFGPKAAQKHGLLDAMASPLLAGTLDSALIVSPFLGNDGFLQLIAEHRAPRACDPKHFHLVSRQDSLDGLNPELRELFSCYTPQSCLADVDLEDERIDVGPGADSKATEPDVGAVRDDEPSNEADNATSDYANVHAKMYVTERYSERNLYLGSLNASRNGITNNVEALLRLQFRKHKWKGAVNRFLEVLTGDKQPFGAYLPSTAVNGEEVSFTDTPRYHQLDQSFHAAAKLLEFKRVSAQRNEDDTYALNVAYSLAMSPACDAGIEFSLAPYLVPTSACSLMGGDSECEYQGLKLTDVSRFFVFSGHAKGAADDERFDKKCLVCCPAGVFDDGAEPEARVKGVLDSILRMHPDALAHYIARAFGVSSEIAEVSERDRSVSGATAQPGLVIGSGIYETLLQRLGRVEDARSELEYAKQLLSYLPEDMEQRRIQELCEMVSEFEKAVS